MKILKLTKDTIIVDDAYAMQWEKIFDSTYTEYYLIRTKTLTNIDGKWYYEYLLDRDHKFKVGDDVFI